MLGFKMQVDAGIGSKVFFTKARVKAGGGVAEGLSMLLHFP